MPLPAGHHVQDTGELEQEETGRVELGERCRRRSKEIHRPDVDRGRPSARKSRLLVEPRKVTEQTDVLVHPECVADHPDVFRSVEVLHRLGVFGIGKVLAELRRPAVFDAGVFVAQFQQAAAAGGRGAVVRQEILSLRAVVKAETDGVRFHAAEARHADQVTHSVTHAVTHSQLHERFHLHTTTTSSSTNPP